MQIQHKQVSSGGIFFINGDREDTVAELTYDQQDPGIMVIEHTEVDKELRGKDLGDRLVNRAVEYARSNDLKIMPVCSFARAVFETNKEYRDVYIQADQ